MKRILLVDDDPRSFSALQRLLRGMGEDWEVVFADSGAKALALMAQSPFDLVISDMLMPGMKGAELLAEIGRKYPQTVRIILSDHTNHAEILRLIGPVHQYISKPLEPEVLRDAIVRTFALQDLLGSEQLKQVVTQIQFLPSVPALYIEIVKELRKDDPSVCRLGQLVSRDPGVCTKMLQLVNSAFFGLPQLITSPDEAILHLGVETVKNVVLSLQLFSAFERTPAINFPVDRLWTHSWKTGLIARRIAEAENFTNTDHAFIAGLLHDIGKLVLAAGLSGQYTAIMESARSQEKSMAAAEREFLGSTHAEVGAYLLGLWGFPVPIIEAVALHHCPKTAPNPAFSLMTAVHVANVLENERSNTARSRIDSGYLTALGLEKRLNFWREYTRKVSLAEAA
jgi:HD-like signal output (HDOD) protein